MLFVPDVLFVSAVWREVFVLPKWCPTSGSIKNNVLFLKLVAQEVFVFHAVFVLTEVFVLFAVFVLLVCAPVLFVKPVDTIAQVFVLLVCVATTGCSSVRTALEIPQHIQQRILDTENTYIVDVKYLVWNDITESYEWEYYSDYNYTLMSKR